MFTLNAGGQVGDFKTVATSGRGLNADEISQMAVDKLLHIADTTPMPIREQAIAFKDKMRMVVKHYVEQAQRSERTTVCNILDQAGQHDAAELLRKL